MTMPAAESTSPPITAEDLERIGLAGKVVELVRGRLVVREPPGSSHGIIAMNLGYLLSDFVRKHGRGVVFAQDTGFKIAANPDTVRAPDVAFLRRDRLEVIRPSGYAAVAPDLLAEVLSPDDRPADVLSKVADWLAAGTGVVWVIDPDRREARIYRRDGSLDLIPAEGALGGEDVLPGFSVPLEEVLRIG
jgi:Uma2 family endonuclease